MFKFVHFVWKIQYRPIDSKRKEIDHRLFMMIYVPLDPIWEKYPIGLLSVELPNNRYSLNTLTQEE